MSYFKTCPLCGAHLDPGESCDCTGSTIPKKRSAVPGIGRTRGGRKKNTVLKASRLYHFRPGKSRRTPKMDYEKELLSLNENSTGREAAMLTALEVIRAESGRVQR